MSTPWIIATLLVIVVGFFAYQWFTIASAKKVKTRVPQIPMPAQNPGQHVQGPATPEAPRPEEYPQVAGQSEGDLRQKEPLQRPNPPGSQQAVTADGKGPADFGENLRRPEQSFEAAGPSPTLKVSDLPAGRAVEPGGQGFSPEMAQNDGPVMGNGVFAFDGMEPTGFANF
jgi:hypothetical protein